MHSILRNKLGERIDYTFHSGDKEGILVIIGHGLTGNKDRPLLKHTADFLSKNGYPCLRLSFSGNGESEGAYTASCISKQVDDLSAVLDQVCNSKKIIYIGHSMGAAVGAMTAIKDDRISVLVSLAGMVETKAFCDTEFGDHQVGKDDMWGEQGFPLSQIFVNDLHTIQSVLPHASLINRPWLLIHGDADDVVLTQDSSSLFEALKKPKKYVVINGANHSFSEHLSEVTENIADWLEDIL